MTPKQLSRMMKARIWQHTNPGNSATPVDLSPDEIQRRREYSQAKWREIKEAQHGKS